uniref:Dynamin N-terminal domain-containing protein n=1 Tax=Amphimedon queenslandica TaxID=400682 RepID=A0A1X7UGH3_AMPQE
MIRGLDNFAKRLGSDARVQDFNCALSMGIPRGVKRGLSTSSWLGSENSLTAYHQNNVSTDLPQDIIETCKLALKSLRGCNNGSLIQERWLAETNHLLQNKTLTIGVFGRHKAGKSTVLNALLHHETLPSAVKNETASITYIHHEPCKHLGKRCSEDCEEYLSIKNTEIKGRRNIRQIIQSRNFDIRENKKSALEIIEVVAHVPFLCPYSTDNIKIVLLDTPGLAESNELGISELSEHQLMTCSAFIYLEDAIDTDTFRAIAERDPGVFIEKRMLIVVTRLDEYKQSEKKCNDQSMQACNSDDDETASLDELIKNIKETIQQQCKFISIPDDCIIPVSSTAALEARKVQLGLKSRDIEVLLGKFRRIKSGIKLEELEETSQLLVLEKKLREIALNSYRLWHRSIVRDCSRYLEQAVRELYDIETNFGCVEDKYNKKICSKERLLAEYRAEKKDLRSKYESDSAFHVSLKDSFDEDVQSLRSKIDEKFNDQFKKFESGIKERLRLTVEEYNSKVEEFIEDANKSLKDIIHHAHFKKMNSIIKESSFQLGIARQRLEQKMAQYCDTTTSVTKSSFLAESEDMTEIISDEPVNIVPLKLKDLLSSVDVERNALLKDLKECLLKDCVDFFRKIKSKLVQSCLQEHKKIAESHIFEWKKEALFYEGLKNSQAAIARSLTKQKNHLTELSAKITVFNQLLNGHDCRNALLSTILSTSSQLVDL